MKKYTIILALLILSIGVRAQSAPIDAVLRSIEQNNKQLQANRQQTESQKLEARTGNNLPDPEFSYAHMWGKQDESISELSITQSFDFPTLYATRNQMNKLRASAYDSQYEASRREILQQAREICLDIIMLRQQKEILDERLRNAQELSAMYGQRLETGDANILETNKINLELLNVKTEATLNETALNNKLQELKTLNGDETIALTGTLYPAATPLPDYNVLKAEVLASDMEVLALDRETAASQKEVSLNKSQWLPRLELGYRRNTESRDPFNGVVVGFSIPIFENRNKVKMAKAQALNTQYQKESKVLEVESELAQQYREAQTLFTSLGEYERTFAAQSDLELLKLALTGGEISMIEYFVEVSVVYQSRLNYIQLQNQYQKVVSRMYKNRL